MQVQPLTLFSGSKIWCCCRLWYRSQMQLGSGVAVTVAYASSCSSDLTSSPGTPICRCGLNRKKKKKKMFFYYKTSKKTFRREMQAPVYCFLFDPILDADLCKNRLLTCGCSLPLLRKLKDYRGKQPKRLSVPVCPHKS